MPKMACTCTNYCFCKGAGCKQAAFLTFLLSVLQSILLHGDLDRKFVLILTFFCQISVNFSISLKCFDALSSNF